MHGHSRAAGLCSAAAARHDQAHRGCRAQPRDPALLALARPPGRGHRGALQASGDPAVQVGACTLQSDSNRTFFCSQIRIRVCLIVGICNHYTILNALFSLPLSLASLSLVCLPLAPRPVLSPDLFLLPVPCSLLPAPCSLLALVIIMQRLAEGQSPERQNCRMPEFEPCCGRGQGWQGHCRHRVEVSRLQRMRAVTVCCDCVL